MVFSLPQLQAQEALDQTPQTSSDTVATQMTSTNPGNVTLPLTTRTVFWHDIEIFNWNTQIEYRKRLSSKWRVEAFENFTSVLQQQSASDVWKDDHYGGLSLYHTINSRWQINATATSKVFRDDFTKGGINTRNNDFSLNRFNLSSEIDLTNRLRIKPAVGYRWENIIGRSDTGPRAALDVSLVPTDWQNYVHQFEAGAEIENTKDRRNSDLNLVYGVSRDFNPFTSDSLFVRFNDLRRENYFVFGPDVFIDLFDRNRRGLENRLRYRVGEDWHFRLHSVLSEADVEINRRLLQPDSLNDTNISRIQHKDFHVNHQAQLLFFGEKLINELFLDYTQLTRTYEIPDSLRDSPLIRRYASEGYDSDNWEIGLSHRLQWNLSKKDSIRWFGSIKRRAFDTANLENPNDHDRLQFQANLLYQHRFSSALSMVWEARSYLEHQVYLKSNLSGDNRWTRVLQLLPQIVFKPSSSVTLKQSFGVRTTYIDYDFPETLSNRRSIILRDFFISDSLSANLSERTELNIHYKLSLEERGLLDWERWLQTPQFDIQRHWAVVTFNHELAKHWTFAPGASYYLETNWKSQRRPEGGLQKLFNHSQSIISPLLEIHYVRPPNVLLIFRARRQISFRALPDQASTRGRNIDTFNLTLQWAL